MSAPLNFSHKLEQMVDLIYQYYKKIDVTVFLIKYITLNKDTFKSQ